MQEATATSLFAQNFEAEVQPDASVEDILAMTAQVSEPVLDAPQEEAPVEASVDDIVASIPDDLTYEQMEAARKALADKMAAKREAQRAADLNTVKALVSRHGFTAADLHLNKTKVKNKTGKTVAPRYRNPENHAEVWTGRGIAPLWIRDVAKEDRVRFEIPA